MANDLSLAGLLDRAGTVFALAGQLGRAFQAEHETIGQVGTPKNWQEYADLIEEYRQGVLSVSDSIKNAPEGFHVVVACLNDAHQLIRPIQEATNDVFAHYLDFYPDLLSVSYVGFEAVVAAKKNLDENDQLAIVDESAKTTEPKPEPELEAVPEFTRLEIYPATPEGHIEFLEWVRDEVSELAKAKAQKSERSYPDDTLAETLRGIKWDEARRRLAAFAGGLLEDLKPVANVLEMSLTIGAIEYIDEKYQSALRWLRDKLEREKVTATNQTPHDRSQNSQKEQQDYKPQHSAEPNPPQLINGNAASGYMGGDELANALGIHETRKEAFFRRLTRARRKRLGDDAWLEPSSRVANSPQFLYRVENPVLQNLAAPYRTPKVS